MTRFKQRQVLEKEQTNDEIVGGGPGEEEYEKLDRHFPKLSYPF